MTTPRQRVLILLRRDILELGAAEMGLCIDRVLPQPDPDPITV